MLDISVLNLANISAVKNLALIKSELVSVEDVLTSFNCLDQSLIFVHVYFVIEFGKSEEVITINSMIICLSNCECSQIKFPFRCSDSTTETWFILINWFKCDPSICVSPESTERRFHVSACASKPPSMNKLVS